MNLETTAFWREIISSVAFGNMAQAGAIASVTSAVKRRKWRALKRR
jgi:hypothetical protein